MIKERRRYKQKNEARWRLEKVLLPVKREKQEGK